MFGNLDEVHAPTAILGLGTLTVLLTLAHFFPRAPVALIGMLGATAVGRGSSTSQEHGRRRGRRHPGRLPGAGPPRRRGRRPDRADRAGHRDRLRRPTPTTSSPGARSRPATARPSTLSASCSRSAAPTSAPACCRGIPVSSSGSRTAIGDAVGQRTQLGGLVTVVVHGARAAHPRAGARGVPGRRPRGRRRVRRDPAGRRTRAGPVRAVPHAASWCWRSRPPSAVLAAAACCSASWPRSRLSVLDLLRRVARPHDAVLGIGARHGGHARRRRLPVGTGGAGADDLPLRLAALLRQRGELPHPRARVGRRGEPAGPVVRAQRRGDLRGRHHRGRRPGGAARGARPPRHRGRRSRG